MIVPLLRPAHRRTVAFRTMLPTFEVPLTAVTGALGTEGLLRPIELPDVTVTV